MFADVILPLAVPGVFTYEIHSGLGAVVPGMRVAVPFGRGRRLYSGLVHRVHDDAPVQRSVRSVLSVLDTAPVVTAVQLLHWERIAEHYMCTMGEVMIASLPAQLSLSSETRIVAKEDDGAMHTDPRAAHFIEVLREREVLTLDQASELLGLKDPMPVVKRLMEEGHVQLEEELRDTWKPRMVTYVELTADNRSEESLHGWFDQLEKKAPKQLQVLMRYVEVSRCMSDDPLEVERDRLLHLSGVGSAVLKQLEQKGLFRSYQREAGRPAVDPGRGQAPVLSPAQAEALAAIHAAFTDRDTVLLRGVTSSGKTEVYITLIDEALKNGGQVLYLLPEIALTTQIIERLRARFGDDIAVFHSRMPQHERTELWLRMVHRKEAPKVVVGARSALFLPFHELKLVVVDEEHDPSYKQHDPAPRYHARDMAIVLAALHGCKTVLGSATPSLESLFNASTGKYGKVELLTRFGDVEMPTVTRVDLRDAQRRHAMRWHFTKTLIEAVEQALARKEQAIIFQNRRGYVPVWQCETCGWVPECDHCDVSLTYHKGHHQLRCHYCGRHYPPPKVCGSCGSARLKMLGFGTEKIEEELGEIFPEARISRMDQDTTRGRKALERILTSFGQGAVDILVGTQMVTKGLDFDHVSVVGILSADNLMRFPDFRAHERAFQLMAQVAGRSGRRKKSGTVLIQAHDVKHPLLEYVVRHDVDGMYASELEHRKAHGYPPFTRLVKLTLKHRYEDRVAATAAVLAQALREKLGDRVLGPEIPNVSRVNDRYIRNLLVKMRRSAHVSEKQFVSETVDRVFGDPAHSPVRLVIDVDPN